MPVPLLTILEIIAEAVRLAKRIEAGGVVTDKELAELRAIGVQQNKEWEDAGTAEPAEEP